MDNIKLFKGANQNVVNNSNFGDDEPHFKDVWENVEKEEEAEEYVASNEIVKDLLNNQEMLYTVLFSVKYFHSDIASADAEFIKLAKKFDTLKKEVIHDDDKIPLLTLAKNHLKRKSSQDDEELQIDDMGAGTFLTKCPISQLPFERPVTQRLYRSKDTCVHTFEESSLYQIMSRKSTIDCPLAACRKKVFHNKLHPDYEYLQHTRYKNIVNGLQTAKQFFDDLRKDDNDFELSDELT